MAACRQRWGVFSAPYSDFLPSQARPVVHPPHDARPAGLNVARSSAREIGDEAPYSPVFVWITMQRTRAWFGCALQHAERVRAGFQHTIRRAPHGACAGCLAGTRSATSVPQRPDLWKPDPEGNVAAKRHAPPPFILVYAPRAAVDAWRWRAPSMRRISTQNRDRSAMVSRQTPTILEALRSRPPLIPDPPLVRWRRHRDPSPSPFDGGIPGRPFAGQPPSPLRAAVHCGAGPDSRCRITTRIMHWRT